MPGSRRCARFGAAGEDRPTVKDRNERKPRGPRVGERSREVLEKENAALRAELEALTARDRRFRTIAEFAPEMIFIVDTRGDVIYVNGYAARQIRMPAEELCGRNLASLFPPPIAARQLANVRAVAESGQSMYVEDSSEFPAGSIWLETWLVPIRDDTGNVTSILGFSRDVSARVRTQKALRDKEELYRTLAEISPDAITITDLRGRIIMANRHALEQAGFDSIEEMAGMNFMDRIAPRHRKGASYNMQKTLKGDIVRNAEVDLVRKDGSPFTVELSTTAISDGNGNPVGYIGITRDITHRRLIEDALRSSEEKYRTLVENLSEVIFSVTSEGVINYVSPSIYNVVGYSAAELVGSRFMDYIHTDDLTGLLGSMAKTLNNEFEPYEFRLVRKDGAIRHVMTSSRPVFEKGVAIGLSGVLTDISARKIVEERLAEEKERLSVTLRSIGDAVITTDIAGTVTLLNGVAEDLTGWSQEEASGRPIDEVFRLVDGKTGERIRDPVSEIIGENRTTVIDKSTILVARDGSERHISDSGSPIRDLRGKVIGAVIVFRDITEQLKLEYELQKTQRLESLGVLAGGIAHDFNNILSIVLGNLSLARITPAGRGDPVAGYLAEAEKGSVRAQELIHQLLTFSRGGAPLRKPARISSLIRESVLFSLQGSSTRCVFNIPENLWIAEVDEGQIRQVFSNLAINASQSMPEGGELEVHADNCRVDGQAQTLPDTAALPPGDYVRIRVRDRGTGIPEENLIRVFDPYFTTKPGGSGLGLAVVYSIVKNHGGYVGVISQPGIGTTFSVFLPASGERPGAEGGRVRGIHRGAGRVLVMDDETDILVMAGRMLAALGYRHSIAHNGEEAIERVREAIARGEPYDIVIMDLTVPGGMGGRTAIGHIKAMDPSLRVIVSSGYSNDTVMSDFRNYGFDGVIAKPYRVEDLSAVLRELMHG